MLVISWGDITISLILSLFAGTFPADSSLPQYHGSEKCPTVGRSLQVINLIWRVGRRGLCYRDSIIVVWKWSFYSWSMYNVCGYIENWEVRHGATRPQFFLFEYSYEAALKWLKNWYQIGKSIVLFKICLLVWNWLTWIFSVWFWICAGDYVF